MHALSARSGRVRFHQQARAAAGDVRNDSRAAMKLGDRAQVDGKCQLDVLTLAQTEIGRLDEDAGCTEIDRFAQASWPAPDGEVHRSTSAMPRMQASFH